MPDKIMQGYIAKDGKMVKTGGGSGGSGTTDYNELTSKPSINGVELAGNKTTQELNIDIPTKLPNPNSITFTGGATGSYDGSSAVTIDIPQGGGETYTLPVATSSILGGIKVGKGLKATNDGILSSDGIPFEDRYIDDANKWLTNGYIKTDASTKSLPKEVNLTWGILFFIAENMTAGTGTQTYYPIDGDKKGSVWVRAIVRKNPVSEWKDISDKDISLNITSANIGQFVRVKNVNAQGIPMEWEVVDIGGGSYVLPQMTEAKLGGAKAKPATEDMTEFVGIDENGLLKHKPGSGGTGGPLQPLTFTGAVSAEYDGTQPVEVKIPAGGGGGSGMETIYEVTLDKAVRKIVYDVPSEYKIIQMSLFAPRISSDAEFKFLIGGAGKQAMYELGKDRDTFFEGLASWDKNGVTIAYGIQTKNNWTHSVEFNPFAGSTFGFETWGNGVFGVGTHFVLRGIKG